MSFKRKSNHVPRILPAGTRIFPSASSTLVTSTGIASLDDILGGGLPLSSLLLVLAPDPHSTYGGLIQKYFIAQGLLCNQKVCVVDDGADALVSGCMWLSPQPEEETTSTRVHENNNQDEHSAVHRGEIKIAWRYERKKSDMGSNVSSTSPKEEEFCQALDLMCQIPKGSVDDSLATGQLLYVDVSPFGLGAVEKATEVIKSEPMRRQPLRLCIPSFGSSQWGDISAVQLLQSLCILRAHLRRYPLSCALVCLPPHISTDGWGGPDWIEKLGWLSDAAITLTTSTADASLAQILPAHHGLLQVHSVPTLHSLIPPSDKHSSLRALSSSSVPAGGSGENNLVFRCTRRRMSFETLHLDLEGGGKEGQSEPVLSLAVSETTRTTERMMSTGVPRRGEPDIEVALEDSTVLVNQHKQVKKGKKVAFQRDAPEVYDF